MVYSYDGVNCLFIYLFICDLQESAGGSKNGLVGERPNDRKHYGVGESHDGLGCARREGENNSGSEYEE